MDQLTKIDKVTRLFELRTEGMSIYMAAKECGVSIGQARAMMAEYLEKFPVPAVNAYRARFMELIEDQIKKALIRQDKPCYIVNAGKLVRMDVWDPATGLPAVDPVTGVLKIGELMIDDGPAREDGAFILKAIERASKLLGLDAAPPPTAPPVPPPPPIAEGDNDRLVAAIREAMKVTNNRIRAADASDAAPPAAPQGETA